MVNCPGIAAIAETGAALAFFRLYLGTTDTAAGSRCAVVRSSAAAGAGVGPGGCSVFHAGLAAASDGTTAAGWSVEASSAEFCECMRDAVVLTIRTTTPS